MIAATTRRVLVVEDDAMVRGMLTRHLRQIGYEVSEAADAETVLTAHDCGGYDLMLTDVHLPGQSGVELARKLKEKEAASPVVFLTGDSDERLARTALDEGAAGYLLKPFEFFELDAVLRTALAPMHQAGRNVTDVVRARSAQAVRLAGYMPERVMLRAERSTPRRSPVGWKAVAAVFAMVGLGWAAGNAVSPTETVPPASYGPQAEPRVQTMFVPLVMETRTYMPRAAR